MLLLLLPPPTEYMAFIDSVEYTGTNKETLHFRMDCIKFLQFNEINIDYLLQLPTIIIEFEKTVEEISNSINKKSFGSLEGKWIKLVSKINLTNEEEQSELFNPQFFDIVPINRLPRNERALFNQLQRVINIRNLGQEITNEETRRLWKTLDEINHVNIYNVGQGSFNSLVNVNNCPKVYFDIGGGVLKYRYTYRRILSICPCPRYIILSHWDLDHIYTACYDPTTHRKIWLVPLQNLGLEQFKLAYCIAMVGKIYLIANHVENEIYHIIKCNGRAQNDSGLALMINRENCTVLLPGDCKYSNIPKIENKQFDALIASHHGSRSALRPRKAIPRATPQSILAYSFGRNTHWQNINENVKLTYAAHGWLPLNQKNTTNGNIALRTGVAAYNTPCDLVDMHPVQSY